MSIDANSPRQHGDVYNTKETKFKVCYNAGANSPAIVFEARTVTDYKDWIAEQLKGKTPVNDEFPCTEDVMRSASTFCYEVYDGEMIVEKDGEAMFNDCCYSSDFYYTN